jgi:hypothetical protein
MNLFFLSSFLSSSHCKNHRIKLLQNNILNRLNQKDMRLGSFQKKLTFGSRIWNIVNIMPIKAVHISTMIRYFTIIIIFINLHILISQLLR